MIRAHWSKAARASVAILPLVLLGCPPKDPPPAKGDPQEQPITMPPVDRAFVERALGPGTNLANKPLVADIDPRGGQEVLVVTEKAGKDYQLAVLQANGRVLSHVPLGGKVLAHANLRLVGELRSMDLLPDGSKIYLMPLETLVYKVPVCGLLAFRYREDALALVGEFASRCWRKEVGGTGADPFTFMKVERGEQLRVVMDDPEGERTYRWDAAQGSFLALALAKTSKKK
jgi:hypothetical protein